jgi:hypothetical protein
MVIPEVFLALQIDGEGSKGQRGKGAAMRYLTKSLGLRERRRRDGRL